MANPGEPFVAALTSAIGVTQRNVRARTVKSVIPFCEGLRRNVPAVNGTKGAMAQPGNASSNLRNFSNWQSRAREQAVSEFGRAGGVRKPVPGSDIVRRILQPL